MSKDFITESFFRKPGSLTLHANFQNFCPKILVIFIIVLPIAIRLRRNFLRCEPGGKLIDLEELH